MHPLLRIPYAAIGAVADFAAAAMQETGALPRETSAPKWRRTIAARGGSARRLDAFAPSRRAASRLAWFHAPSVGESLMALPVVNALRAQHPDVLRALTWFSPSAEQFADRFDVHFRDYLPFDTRRNAAMLLDALQPSVLTYAKLDVWPVLTEAAAKRGVPLALIAGSVRAASSRRHALVRGLLRDAYAALDLVGAASADDAQRLVELGARRDVVSVTGDTRYDQVWERVHTARANQDVLARLTSDRPTLVAGSTWPADESVLLDAWREVRKRIPAARLVLAPHEPSERHLAPLEAAAHHAGWRTVRVSAETPTADADLVLIDTIGVLADLYGAGDAAFVGGGFHRFGLHSVLEPAAHGRPVLFGPAWTESRDAVALAAAHGARSAADPTELAGYAVEWLTDAAARAEAGRAAEGVVERGTGAATRSVALVARLLQHAGNAEGKRA